MKHAQESDYGVVQIGLTTNDLAGSLRLYSELFGFVNAGGIPIWGAPMAIQGLEPSARGLMWWLVGRQRFFQLEVFEYSVPRSQPLRADWRPSDHGWVRFGVVVVDFNATMVQLARWDITPIGETRRADGLRRMAFRDPFVGAVVEVFEDGQSVPGGERKAENGPGPAIVYVACSVSDLDSARRFYADTLKLPIESRQVLHHADHEAMWGLTSAKSEGFVSRVGDVFIEVVHYREPVGRPKPSDYRVSDQGIMNIALGSRSVDTARDLIGRVKSAGHRTGPIVEYGETVGTYVLDPEREFELLAIPEALDAQWGFRPGKPFLGGG